MIETSDIFSINLDRSSNPLKLHWAVPESVNQLYEFSDISEWRGFIANLALNNPAPEVVVRKFERARRLYFLAWVDFDIIKSGELAALAALELALKDVYMNGYIKLNPAHQKQNKPIHAFLKQGLEYMVKHDGLTDEKLPIYQKNGWAIVSNLYRVKNEGNISAGGKVDQTGTLYDIRNSLAHGDPFDSIPYGSLLEVVRDLIGYIYRNFPEYI